MGFLTFSLAGASVSGKWAVTKLLGRMGGSGLGTSFSGDAKLPSPGLSRFVESAK